MDEKFNFEEMMSAALENSFPRELSGTSSGILPEGGGVWYTGGPKGEIKAVE